MSDKIKESEQFISNSRLRMRVKSPFFATLALFAQFKPTYAIDTAATDGKTIFYNPDYLISLPSKQQDGLILHEILHAALLHSIRRQHRIPDSWNIAADIVVNGLIAEDNNYELPPGGIRHQEWEAKSVEEIYELLLQQKDNCNFHLSMPDLLTHPLTDNQSEKNNNANSDEKDNNNEKNGTDAQKSSDKAENTDFNDNFENGKNGTDAQKSNDKGKNTDFNDNFEEELTGSMLSHREADLRAYWQNALQQATIVARTANQGKLPAGIERQLGELQEAQVDWRTYLWRYLVQTPTDFQGYDRRFISRGLYLDSLVGESVQVFVAIDTSGSISDLQMNLFCSELQGILRAYPHINCQLYYADADIYGPYDLKIDDKIPKPLGGGGTSFIPFFSAVEKTRDLCLEGVCVYLTDGYGDFPKKAPNLPLLWVVVPGGLDKNRFPFGEVVKLYG